MSKKVRINAQKTKKIDIGLGTVKIILRYHTLAMNHTARCKIIEHERNRTVPYLGKKLSRYRSYELLNRANVPVQNFASRAYMKVIVKASIFRKQI